MSTQAFLQDYVEEVQEHLLEMEKSLLILEQEGADKEHISHIFRAAHSLKGASAYMGFEGLAKLTHEMESLISEIQRNSRAIPTNGISVLLKCVDMITGAVEHLSREGTEPSLDESFLQSLRSAFSSGESARNFAEKEPVHPVDDQDLQSFFQEEDEELLSIFTLSFRENYTSLVELLESSSAPSLTPDERKTARELAGKLISSARYMDYQPVVTILADWEEESRDVKRRGTRQGSVAGIVQSLRGRTGKDVARAYSCHSRLFGANTPLPPSRGDLPVTLPMKLSPPLRGEGGCSRNCPSKRKMRSCFQSFSTHFSRICPNSPKLSCPGVSPIRTSTGHWS